MAFGSRKDRVVHTRIPEALEREIKRMADALRVPVSNLVRQILEDSMQWVGAVGTRVEEIQREVQRDREHWAGRWARYRQIFHQGSELAGPTANSAVLGWQPLLVTVTTACHDCNRAIGAGEKAFVGLGEDPATRVIRCRICMPKKSRTRLPKKGKGGNRDERL